MKDLYGRRIDYLRISVTEQCNLNCIYCRGGKKGTSSVALDQVKALENAKQQQPLTTEEIVTIARSAAALGICKLKLTGGEPLLQKNFADLVGRLAAIHGIEQLTATSNGLLLEAMAQPLKEAGLKAINISLDSCRAERYRAITGGGSLQQVLSGLEAAVKAGLATKLNCVLLQDLELVEIVELLQMAAYYRVPLRFIELMPLNCNQSLQGWSAAGVRAALEKLCYTLQPQQRRYGNGPAVYYSLQLGGQQVDLGFIEPIHGKFCSSCNRLRLTSTGYLRSCLYSSTGVDLAQVLRSKAPYAEATLDAKLQEAIGRAIMAKPQGHSFTQAPGAFKMNEIGG